MGPFLLLHSRVMRDLPTRPGVLCWKGFLPQRLVQLCPPGLLRTEGFPGMRAPVTPASRRRVRPQPRAPTSTRGFDAPPSIQVAPGQRLKERSTGSVVLSSQDRDRGLSSKAFQGFHASDRIAVWWRNGVTPRRALAAADPSVRGRLPTPHPAFCSSLLGIHVKCPE